MTKKVALLVASLLASSALAGSPASTGPARVEELADIQFTLDSTKLSVPAHHAIGDVATWAKQNPSGTIVLDSYAAGAPFAATKLALERAEAVRDELVKLGANADNIVVATYAKQPDLRSDVAIVVTSESRDAMIAARRNADVVLWGREPFKSTIARR